MYGPHSKTEEWLYLLPLHHLQHYFRSVKNINALVLVLLLSCFPQSPKLHSSQYKITTPIHTYMTYKINVNPVTVIARLISKSRQFPTITSSTGLDSSEGGNILYLFHD